MDAVDIESVSIASVVSVFGAGLLAAYMMYKQTTQDTGVRVSELWIYPVKSCRGIKLKESAVTKRGLKYDREFCLISGKTKRFLSLRSDPKMALVETSIDFTKELLILRAPGMSQLEISLAAPKTASGNTEVSFYGETVAGIDQGDGPSEWISKFLGKPQIRMVRFAPEFKRKCNPKFAPAGQTAFNDLFSFLLASKESLRDLNERLEKPVQMQNFRPNIVVDGCAQPFEEDLWAHLEFVASAEDQKDVSPERPGKPIDQGSNPGKAPYHKPLAMKAVMPCARCKLPTVDANTGIMSPENEPTVTLRTYRTGKKIGYSNKDWANQVFFGQYVDHKGQSGTLRVGDEVHIKLKSFF